MAELNYENISFEAAELLEPAGIQADGSGADSLEAHYLRNDRLRAIPGYRDIQGLMVGRRVMPEFADLPFMTPEGITDTFDGTQYPGEYHRLLTPRLQEMFHYTDSHDMLLDGIRQAALDSTERLLQEAAANGGRLTYDVAVLGSGPHGTAAAMMIREKFPDLNILMVDRNGLGGLWANNGPNASFYMNSRVRRANRGLQPIPRTPGSINPLGKYATLELSDVVRGNYALDIETGDVNTVNGYLAVDDTLIGPEAEYLVDKGEYAYMHLRTPNDESLDVFAGVIIDATGVVQASTLNPSTLDQGSPWYFDTFGIYRHFGNAAGEQNWRPLERFHRQNIIAVAPGDGALTGFEAILGNLPAATYGPYGVGRYRPNSITWVGAPGSTAVEIDECLRSRYKNGIVQALPKNAGDRGAIISPMPVRARGFQKHADAVDVTLANGDVVSGDILLDFTNQKLPSYGPRVVDARDAAGLPRAVIGAGPGSKPRLSETTREVIAQIGIGENTVALWAIMGLTDKRAARAGRLATVNARNLTTAA